MVGNGAVDGIVRLDAVQTASDASLVAHDRHWDVALVDFGNGFVHPGNHDQILWVVKIVALFVDDAVSIEQEPGTQF
jgi:hypothetical protein